MWIHVPELQSIYVRDMEVSNLPLNLLDSTYAPFVTSSATPTPRPLSWRGWKVRPWIQLLFGTISSHSMAQLGVEKWIGSLPVSPANRSLVPDERVELTTTVGSGRRSSVLSVMWDRATSSWRTLGNLSNMDSPKSSPTLPRSGSMRSGACSQRERLAHHIDVTASGSLLNEGKNWKDWPTPVASEAFRGTDPQRGPAGGSKGLKHVATQDWPTPQADDGYKAVMSLETARRQAAKGHQTMLHGAVQMDAEDYPTILNGPPSDRTLTDGGSGSVKVDLNPHFVESLMGVPLDWLTPFTLVEMDSYREWLRKHLPNWQLVLK